MTTANDEYLEHLRDQLTAVLDVVTPSAAPTVAVKRRGKAIRVRRRVGVAVGLGLALVAAALVPSLLRLSRAQGPISPAHKYPKVTVGVVGRGDPRGLIARGAIDGKPWRITLSWQGKDLCVGASGALPVPGCGASNTYAGGWPLTLDGTGGGATEALYGIVAAQVRHVSIELSDGAVLDLHPVRVSTRRWIAVELPSKLAVTKVVAYSRTGELAYAIPFTAAPGGLPSVQRWLRPGDLVPPQFVRLIGSGVTAGKRWSVTVHVGPWGECIVPAIPGDSGVGCWSDTTNRAGVIMGSGGPARPPWWSVAAAGPRVSYLLLTMTDGSTRQVPVVRVGNERLYAIVILQEPPIARWAAYDASGHRLYGGQGAPGYSHS